MFGEGDNALTLKQFIADDKLALIGDSSIDIMPERIDILVKNHLNYLPRPIPQSYSAYTRKLDSIDASHFYGVQRPRLLMMLYSATDGRYPMWDESLTKAAIHLNYTFLDSIWMRKYNMIFFGYGPDNYLLLHTKSGVHATPRFKKISELMVTIDQPVDISFPDTEAIYMTADIHYSLCGELRKLFFQPPALGVTLFPSGADAESFNLIRPIVSSPVLINKWITGSAGLKDFVTGNLGNVRNIKRVIIHAENGGVQPRVKLTFLKFSNY